MHHMIASLTDEESYNDWVENFKKDYPLIPFEMMKSENGRYDIWVSFDKQECDCDDY